MTEERTYPLGETAAILGVPKNVYVLPGNGHANVSWDEPGSNGGFEITKY